VSPGFTRQTEAGKGERAMKTVRFLLSACILLAMALIFSCSTKSDDDGGGGGSGNQGGSDPSSNSGNNNNPSVIPKIKIVNSTGYDISDIRIKPPISTDWGSDLNGIFNLSDGNSKEITLSYPLSTYSEYDIRLKSGSNIFTKYKFTVSNGMTITFTAGDLTDESNFPSIAIQNRTGVSLNSIYVKPSSTPDTAWGKNYGSLSNNNDESISIPIPPSNYTMFDIQVRSSNPTATYTKQNVTVSNGMVLTYTRADSDNPLIGDPIIVIQNSTGYDISDIRIKPPISTDWGSDLNGIFTLSNGKSKTFTLSQSLSANNVDIRLSGNGNIFTKYNFTVSDGMIITFNTSDLTDESNLPSITIQNRTGVSFNSIYVKPSSATDWGKDYGSLSNNSGKSVSIPIPPSNYTEFDIQVKSSNPTATYTKRVTVTNGLVVTYTRADSDTPLPGSPVIVIQNNTGYAISYVYIKSSSSETWGSDISPNIPDGESRAYTSTSLSAGNVDIRLGTSSGISSGNQFVKSNVPVSDGMIVTLTGSDLYTPE
jgi:hypothetical protein